MTKSERGAHYDTAQGLLGDLNRTEFRVVTIKGRVESNDIEVAGFSVIRMTDNNSLSK